MHRATNEKRIDGVFTTLNVIDTSTSIISAGDIVGKGDAIIEGDLTVNGTLTAGMTIGTISSSSVTHIPTLPLTGTTVQVAIDQLGGLSHTQNTDTILAEGTSFEIGADLIHPHINQYVELINGTGGIVLPFTNVDIPFDTQSFLSSDYSHVLGTASITFNQGGVYQVNYQASTIITSGTYRVNVQFQLEVDVGGGFTAVPRSSSYTNNRTTGSGSSSTTNTSFLTVSAGDTLKLVGRKVPVHATTSITELEPNTSSIRVTRMN
jgi:hypothetical protein